MIFLPCRKHHQLEPTTLRGYVHHQQGVMGLVVNIAAPILEGLHEKGPLVTLRNAMSEAQDAPWLDGKTISC